MHAYVRKYSGIKLNYVALIIIFTPIDPRLNFGQCTHKLTTQCC